MTDVARTEPGDPEFLSVESEEEALPARGRGRPFARWLLPGVGAALLVAGAILWLAAPQEAPLPGAAPAPPRLEASAPPPLPDGSGAGETQTGSPPPEAETVDLPDEEPAAPAAPRRRTEASRAAAGDDVREARRFNRYDRNRDGVVSLDEFLAARRKSFDRLDRNGDGVLDFEEYAASTIARFHGADVNRDQKLDPAEFAATATRRSR